MNGVARKARTTAKQLKDVCKADFDRIAEDVKKMKTRPNDGELKELYGLYKQSVVGDINIGLSKEDAMSAYIAKAKELIEKYGI
ncbi:acyl-CoA-binding domain-containing protein 7 isoform X3 [Panthera tigris]|uniref:acyl-CoA-binding domain-containing protein 7 isoform X3 n=1 Tax=Panthera tigris TaxID=9694 RepID=UPI001C6FA497|nr:acyl-CoA-binding domain-containing protein 7 isoform X3 [Panthera tigris]